MSTPYYNALEHIDLTPMAIPTDLFSAWTLQSEAAYDNNEQTKNIAVTRILNIFQ
jgi:hypothetical protein